MITYRVAHETSPSGARVLGVHAFACEDRVPSAREYTARNATLAGIVAFEDAAFNPDERPFTVHPCAGEPSSWVSLESAARRLDMTPMQVSAYAKKYGIARRKCYGHTHLDSRAVDEHARLIRETMIALLRFAPRAAQ